MVLLLLSMGCCFVSIVAEMASLLLLFPLLSYSKKPLPVRGIPAEQLPHLFERFYRVPGVEVQTGSSAGVGLGLYIAQKIVGQHGGHIEVTSRLGEGSTFSIVLSVRPLPVAACPVQGLSSGQEHTPLEGGVAGADEHGATDGPVPNSQDVEEEGNRSKDGCFQIVNSAQQRGKFQARA
jgi:Histidine kinase-, DNA gyrase B-, and HSP90-like ATPase